MRVSSDLSKIQRNVERRSYYLNSIIDRAYKNRGEDQSVFVAFSVLELDNLIKAMLRNIMVSSLLKARTASGSRVGGLQYFGSEEEAAAYILKTLSPKRYKNMKSPKKIKIRDEYQTREPRDVVTIFTDSNLTNLQSAQNASALNFSVFSEIADFRNFFAHRGHNTYVRAIKRSHQLGIYGIHRIDDICLARKPTLISALAYEWVAQVRIFSEEICK